MYAIKLFVHLMLPKSAKILTLLSQIPICFFLINALCSFFYYSSAVCCLALLMSAYSVPENLDIGMDQSNCERNLVSVLKEAIMKWVLSCCLEEEMEECVKLPPVLCRQSLHGIILYVNLPCNAEDCPGESGFADLYDGNALVEVGFLSLLQDIIFGDIVQSSTQSIVHTGSMC